MSCFYRRNFCSHHEKGYLKSIINLTNLSLSKIYVNHK
ncbi:hypothetical protein BVAVS116_K0016 (plasmid) [Borreliella valaisiana VS116]|uniref:Uncharacterized protein n=1 Tax=Borreliella valaisiana VS116 TaxID=445987 RepID=C0R8K9_BORVA|nr:hypothetical protein BVAVS116_K0016 [Borreliella valaisiana VS116]